MQKVVLYTDFVSKLKEIFVKSSLDTIFYLPTTSYRYKKVVKEEDFYNIPFTSIRMIDPIKTFLFKHKENLVSQDIPYNQISTIYVVGVKSCDINALNVLNNMFITEEYVDPNYSYWQKKLFIISSDCPYPQENCFCSIIKGTPYPVSSFDINISFIDENNFILESGSEKGEEFLSTYFGDKDSPTKNDIEKRNNIRNLAVRKIKEFNKEYIEEKTSGMSQEVYYKIVSSFEQHQDIWKKESLSCVQCLGCNYICPSCYCFLIRENSNSYKEQFRDRVWDSCHSTGYGRVAGGANPRKFKFQRFRNRYLCKFVFRKENFGFYGCTGCGRCIEVCPAKIDMRKVIRNLVLSKGEQVLV